MNYSNELKLALSLVEQCGEIQKNGLNKQKEIFLKEEDKSPVTEIDRKCEILLRENILRVFPSDSFLGEESGYIKGSSGRCWIIDPLDGTRPYIRNIPTYGTLIGLEEENRVVVGVIHLPALNITCWASLGEGAFLNGKRIHVSSTSNLERAIGSALGFLEKDSPQYLREKLLRFMNKWDYAYGFMDSFSYVCVASGRLDLCINLLDKPWDCAAAACIITEAGGKFSDIRGNYSIYNGSTVLSNGFLFEEIIEFFREEEE